MVRSRALAVLLVLIDEEPPGLVRMELAPAARIIFQAPIKILEVIRLFVGIIRITLGEEMGREGSGNAF